MNILRAMCLLVATQSFAFSLFDTQAYITELENDLSEVVDFEADHIFGFLSTYGRHCVGEKVEGSSNVFRFTEERCEGLEDEETFQRIPFDPQNEGSFVELGRVTDGKVTIKMPVFREYIFARGFSPYQNASYMAGAAAGKTSVLKRFAKWLMSFADDGARAAGKSNKRNSWKQNPTAGPPAKPKPPTKPPTQPPKKPSTPKPPPEYSKELFNGTLLDPRMNGGHGYRKHGTYFDAATGKFLPKK